MRKAYIQPCAEILKLSSLIDDFLSLSMDGPGSDDDNKPDNGMGDTGAEIVPSIPSFW